MTDEAEVTEKPKKTYFTWSPALKNEAISLWKLGELSAEEIATKLAVDVIVLRRMLGRNKVKKGELAAAVAAKTAAVMEKALTLDPEVHARRVFDTKNETYRIAEMLRKLVAKEIIKCTQEGRKLGTIQNEIKTIREAAMAIKTCREEAYAVLGIRPEDQGDEALPDLTITDLTEDDIADLQAMPPIEGMGDVPDIPEGEFLDPLDDDEGNGQ